jgi:diketogulonate reductase-like aldo/keto reductase
MEYSKLGNSDLQVSRLCVGCMSFGDPESNFHAWTLGSEESEILVKRALDLGINFFDTANIYSDGTSEEYLGRALKNNIARDKVVIATKVYFNEGKLSKSAILREIDGSLKRLGTDYVDLTSFTASITIPRLRRPWKPWIVLSRLERCEPLALPQCMVTSFITCRLPLRVTVGRRLSPCRTTTICFTVRTSGN